MFVPIEVVRAAERGEQSELPTNGGLAVRGTRWTSYPSRRCFTQACQAGRFGMTTGLPGDVRPSQMSV